VTGPQKGGICGCLQLHAGKYTGQAAVPNSTDKRYFTRLHLAPYSKKVDHHLDVFLLYPQDAPAEFVRDFQRLVDEFDRYIEIRGR